MRTAPGQPIKDSSYKARYLVTDEMWLVAAESHVAPRGLPSGFSQLSDWAWIEFPPGLTLARFIKEDSVADALSELPTTAVVLDGLVAAEHLAIQGAGLVVLPRVVVEPAVRDGELMRVLPDVPLHGIDNYLLWPPNTGRDSPAAAVGAFIVQHFRTAATLEAGLHLRV